MGPEYLATDFAAVSNDAIRWKSCLAFCLATVGVLNVVSAAFAGCQVTVDEDVVAVFSQIAPEEWEQLGRDPSPTTRFMAQLANVDDATLSRWESTANVDAGAGQRYGVGDCVRLQGRVTGVASLLPAARAGELPDYLRTRSIEMVTEDGVEITLLANQVPAEFLRSPHAENQPVRCVGIVLRSTDREIVVGTNRVAWFPESIGRQPPGPAGRQLLADLGIDIGLLDPDYVALDRAQVESLRYAALTRAARVLGSAERVAAVDAALTPFDLVTLVQDHRRQQGALMMVEGEVRRIMPIRGQPNGAETGGPLSPGEVSAGGDKSGPGVIWYQLDVFVPLGNKRISLASQSGGEAVSITGSYGVTLLLPDLPDDLTKVDLPVSIACPGLFWKLWRHSIETESSTEYRPNPVLFGIGERFRVVEQGVSNLGFLRGVGLFWAALVCLGVAFALGHWRRHRNRNFRNADEAMDARQLSDELTKLLDSPETNRYP